MFTQGHFISGEVRIKEEADYDQAIAALNEFVIGMNSEEGCSMAVALQDKKDKMRFLLWERYEDEAAFQAHFNQPHTQKFINLGLTELIRAYEAQLPDNATTKQDV